MSHAPTSPAIHYWGTPVVLVTTLNEDGTANIAPMSSAWWIGNSAMLGLQATSQTTTNLLRTSQCVLNLPSSNMIEPVNAIARTTGTPDIPADKIARGYTYVKDKFSLAKLTPQVSEIVTPPRIMECPVQMEAQLTTSHEFLTASAMQGFALAVEVKILKTYVVDHVRMERSENRIDPDKWRPMIMSFQELYGLTDTPMRGQSKLAEVEEELYRMPEELEQEE